MNDSRSVTSSVEVPLDPSAAFDVFTQELDSWWVPGPINFHDSSRAYANRMEPGVGGRIVEVYDEATGDGLELARMTVWEPGARLGWKSTLDDVEIEVRFEPSEQGTVVRVTATVPAGGSDRGGSAWVRMTPVLFGRWVRRRDHLSREPGRQARLAVGVHYAKPAAAARWLRDVFALEPSSNIPEDDTDDEHTWIEFRIGESSLMVFKRENGGPQSQVTTHTPWVFVDDLDAHFARAKVGGAQIVNEIWQHGARAYDAADLEGNRWTFAQAGPLMG